jgi:hypothetical protein
MNVLKSLYEELELLNGYIKTMIRVEGMSHVREIKSLVEARKILVETILAYKYLQNPTTACGGGCDAH